MRQPARAARARAHGCPRAWARRVITTKQVTDLVMDIIKKSAVGVPTEEMLEEMGIEEDPILVVAPEDPEVGFNVEEDVRSRHAFHCK